MRRAHQAAGLLLAVSVSACGNAAPSTPQAACPLASTIHMAGDAIVAAVDFARAGNATAASQKGQEAQNLTAAAQTVLNSVPPESNDESFRMAANVAIASITQASFVFAGFVPDDPPSVEDMVANSAAVLEVVNGSIARLDQASDGAADDSLCGVSVAIPAS